MKGDASLTEKEFQKMLADTFRLLGWHGSHFHDSRRQVAGKIVGDADAAGFPDWVLFRDRVLFAELKREKTKPTDNQVYWLDGLAKAGGEVYLWRPSDLDEIGLVLSGRWHFWQASDQSPPYLTRPLQDPFVPRSIWVPGVGRADEGGIE